MSFTDRFLEFPIKKYVSKEADLVGQDKVNLYECWIKLNPFEIAYYEEGIPGLYDTTDPYICLTFKSGDNILIFLTVEEFERRLNKAMKGS